MGTSTRKSSTFTSLASVVMHRFRWFLPLLSLLLVVAPLFLSAPRIALANGDLTIRVFIDDIVRDGIFTAGETLFSGATVTVYNSDNQVQGLNNTDAVGLAIFPDLPDGAYRIEVSNINLGGTSRVISLPIGDNALVSFVNLSTDTSRDVGLRDLSAGIDPDAPAGLRSVSVRVWDDKNADGIQGAAEPGISGVVLQLFDDAGNPVPGITATTDSEGIARFVDTIPAAVSNYSLRITSGAPANYALTTANVGGLLDDQHDSDALESGGQIRVNLPNQGRGYNRDDIDIGFARGSLSGFLWRDINGNGLYEADSGESALNGVTVQLVDANGTVVDTTLTRAILNSPTNESGFYEFLGVPLGVNYRVRVPATQFTTGGPLNGHASPPNPGGARSDLGLINGSTPSGVVGSTSYVETTSFTINATNRLTQNIYLGFYSGSVGDFVWYDVDRNGLQTGETDRGINDLSLFVDLNANCTLDAGEPTTLTDDGPNGRPGYYLFDNLALGSAHRIVLAASNFAAGAPLAGLGTSGSPSTPSFCNSTDATGGVYLTSASLTAGAPTSFSADFGVTRASLGNLVWEDLNGDGTWFPGEPAVPSVTVRLYNTSDTLISTATTNASGNYSFPELAGGSYYVTVDLSALAASYVGSLVHPTGWTTVDPREATAGERNDLSSFVAARTWRTLSFSVTPGLVHNGVDAAVVRPVPVQIEVFEDQNFNNARDAGEAALGLQNVEVRLNHAGPDGNFGTADDFNLPAVQVLTNATGAATIDALPGTVRAQVVGPVPAGYNLHPARTNPGPSLIITSGGTAPATQLFPYYRAVTVSGHVFEDLDYSGVENGAEIGIPSVPVTLLHAGADGDFATTTDNQSFGPTSTNASGDVSFANVPPGKVRLSVNEAAAALNGYTRHPAAANTNPRDITIVSGVAPTAQPFAYYRALTVSGRVFKDLDYSGVQNGAEPGIASVPVTLLHAGPDGDFTTTTDNQSFGPTNTNASGDVSFANVPPGKVRLSVDEAAAALSGYTRHPAVANTNPRDATLVSGVAPTAQPFAYYQVVTVSGRVFNDLDFNGAQNGAEPGIVNVAVTLLHAGPDGDFTTAGDNQTFGPTDTDASGDVSFATVPPGKVRLSVDETDTALNGYTRHPATANTNPRDVTVVSGTNPTKAPFAYYRGSTVSGRVFDDLDFSGAQNGAETGIQNVAVSLLHPGPDGNFATTADNLSFGPTNTNATGDVSFANVPPGTVRLSVDEADTDLTGYTRHPATANTNPRDVTVVSGSDPATAPFAYYLGSTISGRVFDDLDFSGAQNGAETGIQNVAVALLHAGPDGNFATTTDNLSFGPTNTNATGDVSFANVPPGNVRLSVDETDTDLSGYLRHPAAANTNPRPMTISSGATPAAEPFAYYRKVRITARVFEEITGTINNQYATGDTGLSGVSVRLETAGGVLVEAKSTGADGSVEFQADPGDYRLNLDVSGIPAGYQASPNWANPVALGQLNSNATSLTDNAGKNSFGYYRQVSFTGSAWFDSNLDGDLDAGEPAMENIDVTLVNNSSTQIAIDQTDASGAYSFSGIDPTGLQGGSTSYRVCFSLPAGLAFTTKGATLTTDGNSDVNAASSCSNTFSVASNTSISYIDAGYVGTLNIGDLVWDDLNANGLQDGGEPALAGVQVTVSVQTSGGLINSSNPVITQVTTSTTSYTLSKLPPGSSYTVVSVVAPVGYKASPVDQGGNDNLDSDPVAIYATALASSLTNLDFGFYKTTTIGDRVWLDLDGNDTYSAASDVGVPGVTVDLMQGATVVDTTTTASVGDVGRYQFLDIDPGTYSLRFTAPTGYVFVNDGTGSTSSDNDNDAQLTDGSTATFTVNSGQVFDSVDAGLRGTGQLSGLLWIDELPADGQRGAADTGRLGGIQVTLTLTPTLNSTKSMVVTTSAATDGTYSFGNLPAGSGRLVFGHPFDYRPTLQNIGDDATDSDGPVVTLNLATEASITNVDQGYKLFPTTIWLPLLADRSLPDLQVSFTVNPASPQAGKPASVAVTVTNRGRASAHGFWVDLYINPLELPTVNKPWDALCGTISPCYGIAWYVEDTLDPGESLVLNSEAKSAANPNGYVAKSSFWNGYFANGTSRLYVFVDSWNRSADGNVRDPNGAVPEENEANNLASKSITVTPGVLPGSDALQPNELER